MVEKADLRESFRRDGFVVVPDLIAPDELDELKGACERVVERTRSGRWPHRRVVGKQFPPFDADNPDSWGVQHVMHPDLEEPAFVRWYTSKPVVEAVCALLDCREEHLQMELFNLLINPASHEFALRWHRDDVRENASEKDERQALSLWHHGIQWNTALYEDASLFVVPGSHATPRTAEQRAHSSTLQAPEDPLAMPGSIQLTLKPGESVFYNSNILHCAAYSPASKRATLHASMGDVRGGNSRARNVLQHGLAWMRGGPFRRTLPSGLAEDMLKRLEDMQDQVEGDVGYSLNA